MADSCPPHRPVTVQVENKDGTKVGIWQECQKCGARC